MRTRSRCIVEYRILGKRGCECFRAKEFQTVNDKMHELRRRFPTVAYRIQSRVKRLDSCHPEWEPWLDH